MGCTTARQTIQPEPDRKHSLFISTEELDRQIKCGQKIRVFHIGPPGEQAPKDIYERGHIAG